MLATARTNPDSALYASCAAVHAASARLLLRAQTNGIARADMTGDDPRPDVRARLARRSVPIRSAGQTSAPYPGERHPNRAGGRKREDRSDRPLGRPIAEGIVWGDRSLAFTRSSLCRHN